MMNEHQLNMFGSDMFDDTEFDPFEAVVNEEASFYFSLQDLEEMILKYGAERVLKEISEDAFYELKEAFDGLGQR